jgi:DoxX-like family
VGIAALPEMGSLQSQHWRRRSRSYDRPGLRLKRGLDSALSGERSLVHALARGVLGLIWVYQGVVPKLLFPEGGELLIIQATGIFPGNEAVAQTFIGLTEAALGLLVIACWRARWPLVTTLVVLGGLLAGAIPTNPGALTSPFNAPTLALTMAALAGIGLIVGRDLPSATRDLHHPVRSGDDG